MRKTLSKLTLATCLVVGFSSHASAISLGELSMGSDNPYGGETLFRMNLMHLQNAEPENFNGTPYIRNSDKFVVVAENVVEDYKKEIAGAFRYDNKVYMRAQDLADLVGAEVEYLPKTIIFQRGDITLEIEETTEFNLDTDQVNHAYAIKEFKRENNDIVKTIIDDYKVIVEGDLFGVSTKYIPVRLVIEKLGLEAGWVSWKYDPNEALFVYKETAE